MPERYAHDFIQDGQGKEHHGPRWRMPGEGRGLALQLLKWNGQGRSQQIDGGGPEMGLQQVQVA